jgi:3-hydroxyisobutyrate dehydrogenase-like beta-hydroxyacid dehydrogenase
MKMFSDMGVPTKETPFEVAEASDVVITMLPSSSHVSIAVPFGHVCDVQDICSSVVS